MRSGIGLSGVRSQPNRAVVAESAACFLDLQVRCRQQAAQRVEEKSSTISGGLVDRTTRGSDEPAAAHAGRVRFDPAEQDRGLGLEMLIVCGGRVADQLLFCHRTSHDMDAVAAAQRDRCRIRAVTNTGNSVRHSRARVDPARGRLRAPEQRFYVTSKTVNLQAKVVRVTPRGLASNSGSGIAGLAGVSSYDPDSVSTLSRASCVPGAYRRRAVPSHSRRRVDPLAIFELVDQMRVCRQEHREGVAELLRAPDRLLALR